MIIISFPFLDALEPIIETSSLSPSPQSREQIELLLNETTDEPWQKAKVRFTRALERFEALQLDEESGIASKPTPCTSQLGECKETAD